jgi:hypothetical protein
MRHVKIGVGDPLGAGSSKHGRSGHRSHKGIVAEPPQRQSA